MLKKLIPLLLILTLALAFDVLPEEVFNAPVGSPVYLTVYVDATSLVEVDTETPELFSWTEKNIYGTTGSSELIFTPDKAGDFEFRLSDGSHTRKVLVAATETKDYRELERLHNTLSTQIDELETERKKYSNTNTVDIYRTLTSAREHLTLGSGAYNASRYTEAEIEFEAAENEIESANLTLSEVELRPERGVMHIDLAIILLILAVIIVVAAKVFLL